jgi:hypothetical protein
MLNGALAALIVATGLMACSKTPEPSVAPAASTSVASSMQAAMPGMTASQARTGTGALLNYAETKLTPEQFSAVMKGMPEGSAMMAEAGKMGNPTDMAGLKALLNNAGITQEQFEKMVPMLGDMVSKSSGPDAARAFLNVFK